MARFFFAQVVPVEYAYKTPLYRPQESKPMMRSLIIVDDFLNDPFQLRELGLKQYYPKTKKLQLYPGRDSKYPQRINGLDQKIIELVGEPLVPVEGTSHGKFRLALDGEKGNHSVHIDNVHWTAILYLTLPEDCQDGTHLFRHKTTATDRAPHNRAELEELGYSTQERFLEQVIYKNTNDLSSWENILTVPMRFNRLVLLRPQQYHDAGISFGNKPENGRLIYLGAYNNAHTAKMVNSAP